MIERSKRSFQTVIDAERSGMLTSFNEVFKFKDLLLLLVKRDFITLYKQTILGPLWYVIQPVLMTLTFVVIFGRVAGIATDGIPKLPFYLCGIVFWNYFSETLIKVSDTFFANQRIFGKVYFPRIVVPLSIVVSNGLKLIIQFALFIIVYAYYLLDANTGFTYSYAILLLPVFIAIAATLSLSLGMIITALTSKYRDLKFLLQFGVQMLMYGSPIVYPLSAVDGWLKWLVLANPMSTVIEGVKYGFFGVGDFEVTYLIYAIGSTIILFLIAHRVFKSVERNFIDII
jgi:lipopolysaccharide transport system permease protein